MTKRGSQRLLNLVSVARQPEIGKDVDIARRKTYSTVRYDSQFVHCSPCFQTEPKNLAKSLANYSGFS